MKEKEIGVNAFYMWFIFPSPSHHHRGGFHWILFYTPLDNLLEFIGGKFAR